LTASAHSQDNASGYSHSDGTTHSQDDASDDESYSLQQSLNGNTVAQGGSYHSTSHSQSDGSGSGSTSSSHSDGQGEGHSSSNFSDGVDTEHDSAVAHTTDHSDSNSTWSNGVQTGGSSNVTHDDDGNDSGGANLSGGGNSDVSSYDDAYTDHSEQHSTFGGGSSSSSTTDDNGHQQEDVIIAGAGYSNSYGESFHYKDHLESSSGSSGSTSSTTHDDGGNDYGKLTASAPGISASDDFHDEYTNHGQWGTGPGGSWHSSYTASGDGSNSSKVTLTSGSDSLVLSDHGNWNYTASGGVNADRSAYGTFTSNDQGGDSLAIHIDDGKGDTISDTISDTFSIQDTNGLATLNASINWSFVNTGNGGGASPATLAPAGMQAAADADPNSGFFGSLWSSWRSMGDGLLASGASAVNTVYDTGYHPDWEDIYSRGPLGQTNTPNTPGWAYYGTRGALGVATVATAAAAGVGAAEYFFLGNASIPASAILPGGGVAAGRLGSGLTQLAGKDKLIMEGAIRRAAGQGLSFLDQVGALAQSTAEVIPAGQVNYLGAMNGSLVYGSAITGVGIGQVGGITVIVQKLADGTFKILGSFLP